MDNISLTNISVTNQVKILLNGMQKNGSTVFQIVGNAAPDGWQTQMQLQTVHAASLPFLPLRKTFVTIFF